MKLHDLHPKPGAHTPSRRLGRGHGSGRGKTAGRGTKGQKSRAGGGIPAWFEGGQTPLHVRTPKLHGFKNRFRVEYAAVNLAKLAGAAKGTLITPDVLEHDGLVRDTSLPIKILGTGDAPAGVTIHAHAFSRSAREKLDAAGSSYQQISWPDGQPVEASDEPSAAEPGAAPVEATAEETVTANLPTDSTPVEELDAPDGATSASVQAEATNETERDS
jgi:large subunit ribosomal protein L15